MALKSYKDLETWKKAMDLVEEIYRIAAVLPKEEMFGLKKQMQDAAVSVPANIAEGYGRLHRGDYVHHLSFSMGSLMELETHVLIAIRLHYYTEQKAEKALSLVQETSKMLTRLIQSLKP